MTGKGPEAQTEEGGGGGWGEIEGKRADARRPFLTRGWGEV